MVALDRVFFLFYNCARPSVAQLVEQLTLNQRVAGSTPASSTKNRLHPEAVFFMPRSMICQIIQHLQPVILLTICKNILFLKKITELL